MLAGLSALLRQRREQLDLVDTGLLSDPLERLERRLRSPRSTPPIYVR